MIKTVALLFFLLLSAPFASAQSGVLIPTSTEKPDPWLEYLKLHDPDAKTLLDAWRAGVN